MQVAGNIFGQQWPLSINGSSTNPAVNFSGAGQSGISLGISNTLSMHALGNTPLIITANGVNTTSLSVLTTPANVTPTPVIATTIQIADASGIPIDDLALDASNGGFLKITGTGFGGGTIVSVGNVIATATTLVSTTEIIAQVQPRAAGTYPVTITRPDGPFFTVPTGISFSNFPAFSSSNLGNVFDTITLSLVATSDSNVTYANVSALPNTLTLASNGTLTGTLTNLAADTLYSLQIKATDAELQDTTQTFSINARTLFGSPAGVYALRQILGYSGNVVQIRRSSDNALANIGFSNGSLDTSTLLTFAGTNGNAYVQTWYDQSGLGNHLTQATAAAQPGIVGMGQLVTEGGKPALWFDGARYLDGGDVLDLQANSVTTFTTARFRNDSGNTMEYWSGVQILWQKSYFAPGAGRYAMYFLSNAVGVQSFVDVNGGTVITNVTSAYTNVNTYGMRYTRGSGLDVRVNGGTSSITANTTLMTGNISQPFRLGAYTNNDSPSNTPSYFLQGTIQEHLHYFAAIDDERRNAMDANILKYSKPLALLGTIATGGNVSTVGNVVTHTFTSSGTFFCSTQGNVEYLIVGGGGGGGGGTAAGGGGGGVLVGMCSVIANTYSVVVGAGGAGGANLPGSTGQNSSFNSLVAYGGGGGGGYNADTGNGNGAHGGCGGGSTWEHRGGYGTAGQGTPGLGFRGGNATNWTGYYGAGGGGGGGGVGVDGTSAGGGNGGIGFLSSITGTATYYGGGGGGGTYGGGTLGLGGLGGGGNAPAGTGTPNTGGGGGGQKDNLTTAAGSGGSGIVILRYVVPMTSSSPYPLWATSTLANVIKTVAFTQTLSTTQALGNNVTYVIANGSSLPANVTLASNGVLSGNITENPGNATTYYFTLDTVDAQFQNIPRSFGLTALASFISASGGTITTSGAYKIHTFTTSGTFTFTSSGNRTFEVLVVAGGGGGGGSHGGGGGGGGGVVSSTGVVVPNGVYTITVGGGGTGGSAPVAGNDSSALGLTAVGGGRGGQADNAPGGNGGSGGGGSGDTNAPNRAAGSGTAGQGYGGGTGNNTIGSGYGVGGGGGGAGQVGANATNSGGGNGGNGVSSSISGSVVYYAGGGGGGGWVGIVNGGIGGLGGGGNTVSGGAGLPGTPNSGGGGAGSDASASPRNGGNGGTGIVIVRYIM